MPPSSDPEKQGSDVLGPGQYFLQAADTQGMKDFLVFSPRKWGPTKLGRELQQKSNLDMIQAHWGCKDYGTIFLGWELSVHSLWLLCLSLWMAEDTELNFGGRYKILPLKAPPVSLTVLKFLPFPLHTWWMAWFISHGAPWEGSDRSKEGWLVWTGSGDCSECKHTCPI